MSEYLDITVVKTKYINNLDFYIYQIVRRFTYLEHLESASHYFAKEFLVTATLEHKYS